VVGVIMFGVLCLGTTVLAGGGGGRFFGSPPNASSKGPTGGVTIQQSPPPTHGQQTPVTARHPVCSKGIVSVLPRDTKSSASLLPCYEIANLPTALKLHRETNEGQ
jgi:hypothetical protein